VVTHAGPQVIEALETFQRLLNAKYLAQPLAFFFKMKDHCKDAARTVLDLPEPLQVEAALEVARRVIASKTGRAFMSHAFMGHLGLSKLLSALLRKKLPFTALQLEELIVTVAANRKSGYWSELAIPSILGAVEEHAQSLCMTDSLKAALGALAASLRRDTSYAEARKLLARTEALLHREGGDKLAPAIGLVTDEAWTNCLRQALHSMDEKEHVAWQALLVHCSTASGSKPSGKWLKEAQKCVAAIGTDEFAALMLPLLAQLGKPGAPKFLPGDLYGYPPDLTLIHDQHSDLLRGLIWCTSIVNHDALTSAVGDAAEVCFRKVPGIGPRSSKIGNGCLQALAGQSNSQAISQLSRLKSRAKHSSTRKQLAKALDKAAVKTGMSAEELEESSVPSCGLTGVGEARIPFGGYTAVVEIKNGSATVRWEGENGKAQKTMPATLRSEFASEVAAFKRSHKEIDKLLPAQRDRLERLYRFGRRWSLPEFQSGYLDHPLVGTIARRLVWSFERDGRSAKGIWDENRIVDSSGERLTWLGASTQVSLWHPLGSSAAEVKGWREWLENHDVQQPFKQAHREIYVLTDAERQTEIYSNRFASHILKQHQFRALAQSRGWRYTLQGQWDSANTPTLEVPEWDLRAEYWVEPIQGDGAFAGGDTSHAGIFLFLTTDQVRFYRLGEGTPVPVTEVAPLAFSEIMRDVDLFVGVSSIGNDPNWTDSGFGRGHIDYWNHYAFGELFPTAQTRKAVLERMVPRLMIADRCSFLDRYLRVCGKLGTYKIHLGSGNILMEPNDQYLCIVPVPPTVDRSGKVYLPFEGDHMLSIIISKALLLADDDKIKDPSIRAQIGR
jgi:hypothetical protein